MLVSVIVKHWHWHFVLILKPNCAKNMKSVPIWAKRNSLCRLVRREVECAESHVQESKSRWMEPCTPGPEDGLEVMAGVVGRRTGTALNFLLWQFSKHTRGVGKRGTRWGERRGWSRGQRIPSTLRFWWPCSFITLLASRELFLLMNRPFFFFYFEQLLNSWPCLAAMLWE